MKPRVLCFHPYRGRPCCSWGWPCQGCITTTEEETFLEWGIFSAGRHDLGRDGRVNIMKSSKLIATGLHDGDLHSWDDPRFIRQAKTHGWNKERQTWLGRDRGKWLWGSPVCGGVEALDGHQHLGWIPGIMQFRNSEIDRRRKIQFFLCFFFFGGRSMLVFSVSQFAAVLDDHIRFANGFTAVFCVCQSFYKGFSMIFL